MIYRITSPLLSSSPTCPPSLVSLVFPAFHGWPCVHDGEVCLVTAPSPQTPTDLGPLVKVELVPSE
jgi:hypothetical protein